MKDNDYKVKFNGNLASRWASVKPGPSLKSILYEFRMYIEVKFDTSFHQYLKESHHSRIRLDFDIYYNHLDYVFGTKSEIPF